MTFVLEVEVMVVKNMTKAYVAEVFFPMEKEVGKEEIQKKWFQQGRRII